MKKTIALTLAIIMCLSLTACTTQKSEDKSQQTYVEKWLLTYEKDVYPDGTVSYEEYYDYDSNGKLIENYYIDGDDRTDAIKFAYNEKGMVISKKSERFNYLSEQPEYKNYTYEYDNIGNCITQTITYSSGRKCTYSFTYDDYNNIIKEVKEEISPTNEIETTITTRDFTYQNGKCTQSKTTITDDIVGTYYTVEKYMYDDNGNLSSKERYDDFVSGSDKSITIDGKEYGLGMTTYYTYEKFNVTIEETTATQSEKNEVLSVEIGFDNINEWGCKLIELQANENDNYVSQDDFGIYVIIKEGTKIWEFYPEKSYAVMSSYYINGAYSTEATGTYTILDNNTFSCDGYTMRIINRLTVNGVNIIDMTNGGSRSNIYIPYSSLDIDSLELLQEDAEHGFNLYKCYIK